MDMKKMIVVVMMLMFMTGCGSSNSTLKPALELRNRLLAGNGCSFDAVITADYGEKLYNFEMHCDVDSKGDMQFSVIAPESIQGISGIIDGGGGRLTYEDFILAFPNIIDDNTTPVMAPWILINSLRCGYIQSVSSSDEYDVVTVNDSYEDDALELDVWLGRDGLPVGGEILYRGRRYLTVNVTNFAFS